MGENKPKLLRGAVGMLLALVLLSACGSNPPPPAPPPVKKKTHQTTHRVIPAPVTSTSIAVPGPFGPPAPEQRQRDIAIEYEPDAYLLHLSLAELALKSSPSDIGPASADLDMVRVFSQQRNGSGNVLQPAVILECTFKGQREQQHIAVPFTMPHASDDFPGMVPTLMRLNDLSCTMDDLKLVVISVPSVEVFFEDNDPHLAASEVGERLNPLLRKAAALPAVVQARIYLQLSHFYMQHNYKDPAYLALVNAKHALATAAESSKAGDSDESRGLTREIDAQEAQLRKTMPFTLNF